MRTCGNVHGLRRRSVPRSTIRHFLPAPCAPRHTDRGAKEAAAHRELPTCFSTGNHRPDQPHRGQGEREEGRERGGERERKGRREGGRDEGKEGGKEGERKGRREGGTGREGGSGDQARTKRTRTLKNDVVGRIGLPEEDPQVKATALRPIRAQCVTHLAGAVQRCSKSQNSFFWQDLNGATDSPPYRRKGSHPPSSLIPQIAHVSIFCARFPTGHVSSAGRESP